MQMTFAAFALMAALAAPALAVGTISCEGDFRSGGFAVCEADAPIKTDVGKVAQGKSGPAFIAIPRGHSGPLMLSAGEAALTLTIAPRDWAISRIDGLPPGKVRAQTPEEQRKVAEGAAKKNVAWQSRLDADWFARAFQAPVTAAHRISGVFGSERILNGEQAGRVHQGLDFAAPPGKTPAEFVGTPVVAPAAGNVVLADPDLYYEGGFVVIDHGQGVMSLLMHLSEVNVATGDHVERGVRIGAVGSTGRSTGPHLHWGVRVDGAYIDPAALLLEKRSRAVSH
jgi:murein DD-endopeptidase MepM/ murein hydrolase activator NlpD